MTYFGTTSIPTEINSLCNVRTLAVDFEGQDIFKIIWASVINEAHGHHNISTHYCKTIANNIRLFLKFWNLPRQLESIKYCTSPQKRNKQLIQNYCPVSLMQIRSKIFERLVFNLPYKFVGENSLFHPNQYGFRKADSFVYQNCFNHELLKMIMMMMTMNCFVVWLNNGKRFSLISSQDHCQRSSPSRISDRPR